MHSDKLTQSHQQINVNNLRSASNEKPLKAIRFFSHTNDDAFKSDVPQKLQTSRIPLNWKIGRLISLLALIPEVVQFSDQVYSHTRVNQSRIKLAFYHMVFLQLTITTIALSSSIHFLTFIFWLYSTKNNRENSMDVLYLKNATTTNTQNICTFSIPNISWFPQIKLSRYILLSTPEVLYVRLFT